MSTFHRKWNLNSCVIQNITHKHAFSLALRLKLSRNWCSFSDQNTLEIIFRLFLTWTTEFYQLIPLQNPYLIAELEILPINRSWLWGYEFITFINLFQQLMYLCIKDSSLISDIKMALCCSLILRYHAYATQRSYL